MAATVLGGRNSLETTFIYVLLASCICLSLTQPTVRQIRFSGDGCFGRIKWPHHPFRRFHREWKNLVESVLIEVKRQTNENNELRHEVEELRNTSAQYKQLLMDMASNVDRLVKTLVDKEQQQYQKQQKQQCSCESIVDNAELESMTSVTLKPGFAVEEDNIKKKSSSRYANRIIEDNAILSNYGSGGNDLRKSKIESAKSPTTDTYNDGPITRQFLINGSYPKDCDDILLNGRDKDGIYSIKPNFAAKPFQVECEFKDGKAWTLIQKRTNGAVDFYRNWEDYKEGFGNIRSEYWLGNEKIYYLSVQATYELKVNMWDWSGITHGPTQQTGNYYEGGSSFFYIEDEKNFYRLRVPEVSKLTCSLSRRFIVEYLGLNVTDMRDIRVNC
ncbi:angiopoietin-related protein 1 [Octopus bimaculoides]|uniref:angiopoietin-related protein 1 n=1 Tax=Octopus bimaculoides TaxID=37653 RepID=UPI0022E1677B|nr:angiopoietin-related protein 1 [Octopus bimaculoides]